MKIPMKKIILLLLCMVLGVTTSYAKERPKESYENYVKGYEKVLKGWKKEFKKMPQTGDVTIDFLDIIVKHHEGTLAMIENELAYGDNPVIWQFARGIKNIQYKRKSQIELLIKQLKKEKQADKETEKIYLGEAQKILQSMLQQMEKTDCKENVDKAYVLQMTISHEATNQLAEHVMKYSNNAMVQEIAQKMVNTQTKEIKKMQKFAREIR